MKATDPDIIQRAIDALPPDHPSRAELAGLKDRFKYAFASVHFNRMVANLEPSMVKHKCRETISKSIAKFILDAAEIHYAKSHDDDGNEIKDWAKMIGVVAVVMPAMKAGA